MVENIAPQATVLKTLLFLCALFILNGCSTTKTALKQDVDIHLTQEQGYLLIGIDTNQDLQYLNLDGETKLQFTKLDLQKGSSYILTTVPVGEYYIRSIGTGGRRHVRLKQDNWSFEVKPQQISYIGDLDFRSHRYFSWIVYAEMDNRSSSAIRYLKEQFPNILNNRQLHYSGPGEDRFLDYYYRFIQQQKSAQSADIQANNKEVKS